MPSSAYNYANFPPEDDVEAFSRFASHLKVGDRGPDPQLIELDNLATTRLSDFTDQGITVVEFGSLT